MTSNPVDFETAQGAHRTALAQFRENLVQFLGSPLNLFSFSLTMFLLLIAPQSLVVSSP